ncbi:hypothetical protein ACFSC4_15315 [Deinococcus malanensis]|uniref:hypothetical protein n=1 Tax=Deinococcus malanensis TaxID=1706855 RepID=UPI0036297073
MDIQTVHGTGIAGRISEEDVRRTLAGAQAQPAVSAPAAPEAQAAAPRAAAAATLPNFEKWGQYAART